MKNIKIILALTLALVLLTGCGGGVTAADLAGDWHMTIPCPQEDATYLLDAMDLYAEERAFVDLDSLNYILKATFAEDGSYSFAYDVEANKVCVREFYEGVMTALYDNRAELTGLYGEEIAAMTRDEFNQFYADIYSVASYDFLLDRMVEYAYDYEVLGEPIEVGTFKIVGSNLMCEPTDGNEAGSIGFQLDGDTLTLSYSDGEEVYTRVK